MKQLLLTNLCGRLPYGVKCEYQGKVHNILGYAHGRVIINEPFQSTTKNPLLEEVKLYLFPISSMTDEQEENWYRIYIKPLLDRLDHHTRTEDLMLSAESMYKGLDWLNKNHIDYSGLIDKSLALDATGLDIY